MDLSKLKENKIFLLLMGAVVVLVVVMIAVSLFSMFKTERVSNYSSLETSMITAAKSYYRKNADRLPAVVGSTIEIDAESLAKEGHMDSLSKLAPKGSTCTGHVVVKNSNGNYYYQAFLDCGERYQTMAFHDYVLKTTEPVTTGIGLYKVGNDFYYRGETPNNYITFADMMYRIVRINEDGTMDIIADGKRERNVWDDRYNEDRQRNDGINTYSLSRVKDSLLAFINSESFTDDNRLMLEPMSLCVGKMLEDGSTSLNQECSSRVDNQLVGLLPLSVYTYASLDPACTTVLSGTCQNYNYLNVYTGGWWTLTGDLGSSHRVAQVLASGSVIFSRTSATASLREVLRISNQAVYVSGDGTIDNPFAIK